MWKHGLSAEDIAQILIRDTSAVERMAQDLKLGPPFQYAMLLPFVIRSEEASEEGLEDGLEEGLEEGLVES